MINPSAYLLNILENKFFSQIFVDRDSGKMKVFESKILFFQKFSGVFQIELFYNQMHQKLRYNEPI